MDSAGSSHKVLSALIIDISLYVSVLNFSFIVRTLLALGCHVAQVYVHAEDDLKKIKLPKE